MDFTAALNETPDPRGPSLPALPDMAAVKKRFAPYRAEIERMKAAAQAHEVADEDGAKNAVAMAGEAKRLVKEIEARRKEIVDGPNRFVKAVNGFCKDFTGPLRDAEDLLKRKIGQYRYKVELERRKQEEAIRKANEELQKKLEAEAEAAGVEAPKVTPMPVPRRETVTRAETGAAAHIRKVWKAEITDSALVPREYCEPSMKLIDRAVRMGVREIPGVRIFEDVSTVLRT